MYIYIHTTYIHVFNSLDIEARHPHAFCQILLKFAKYKLVRPSMEPLPSLGCHCFQQFLVHCQVQTARL